MVPYPSKFGTLVWETAMPTGQRWRFWENGGRVTLFPLCFMGPNDKLHLLLSSLCETEGCTISDFGRWGSITGVLSHRRISGPSGDAKTVRNFLGQSLTPVLQGLMEGGLALDILLDEFFLVWTTQSSTMPRYVCQLDLCICLSVCVCLFYFVQL